MARKLPKLPGLMPHIDDTKRQRADTRRTGRRPYPLANGTQTVPLRPIIRTLHWIWSVKMATHLDREGHTETSSMSCLNDLESPGKVRSQRVRAGPTHVEVKLAVNAYMETEAKHRSFLHGAQLRGSAGSAVGTGYFVSRSAYFPFFDTLLCS